MGLCLVGVGSRAWGARSWAEEGPAITAADQEDEPFQVAAELAKAVAGVAGELFQGSAEPGRVTGQPAGKELQHLVCTSI